MDKYIVEVTSEYTRYFDFHNPENLHRLDGPAVEYASGSKAWYANGERHREDGPAIEYADGYKEWWMNGQRLTEQEFNNRSNPCSGKIVEIDGKKYKLTPA